jgi:hypothetical protein
VAVRNQRTLIAGLFSSIGATNEWVPKRVAASTLAEGKVVAVVSHATLREGIAA